MGDGDCMEQKKIVKLKPIVEQDIEIVWKMQVDAFSELLEKYKDFDMSTAAEKIDKVNARFKQSWTTYYFILADDERAGVSPDRTN